MKNLHKVIKDINHTAREWRIFGSSQHLALLDKLMAIQEAENRHELEMAHRRSKWQTVREFFGKHYGLGGGFNE